MKRLNKLNSVLKDTSGETMVEVIVAFTLLTIMLVVFSQGLASATTSEVNAKNTRDNADQTMIKLQKHLASDNPTSDDTTNGIDVTEDPTKIDVGDDGKITKYSYEVDGNVYIVFMPAT